MGRRGADVFKNSVTRGEPGPDKAGVILVVLLVSVIQIYYARY